VALVITAVAGVASILNVEVDVAVRHRDGEGAGTFLLRGRCRGRLRPSASGSFRARARGKLVDSSIQGVGIDKVTVRVNGGRGVGLASQAIRARTGNIAVAVRPDCRPGLRVQRHGAPLDGAQEHEVENAPLRMNVVPIHRSAVRHRGQDHPEEKVHARQAGASDHMLTMVVVAVRRIAPKRQPVVAGWGLRSCRLRHSASCRAADHRPMAGADQSRRGGLPRVWRQPAAEPVAHPGTRQSAVSLHCPVPGNGTLSPRSGPGQRSGGARSPAVRRARSQLPIPYPAQHRGSAQSDGLNSRGIGWPKVSEPFPPTCAPKSCRQSKLT